MWSTRERQGSTATEYALIAALLGAGLVVAVANLGAITETLFSIVEVLASAVL
jgi:Flp pilus assembly pilin Flp